MEQDNFLLEIRHEFLEESKDLLEQLSNTFLDFEKDGADSPSMPEILRVLHNLKGSGKAVEFHHLGEFAHQVEDLFIALRDKKLDFSPPVISLIWEVLDLFQKQIEALKNHPDNANVYAELLQKIASLDDKAEVENVDEQENIVFHNIPEEQNKLADTAEMSDEEALRLMQQMEEGTQITPRETEEKNEVPAVPPAQTENAKKQVPTTEETIKLKLSKVDNLLNYFGEQVILQSRLNYLVDSKAEQAELKACVSNLQKVTFDLQQMTINFRVVPVAMIFNRLERIARDTARATGKTIEFEKIGAELELDKTIVDNLFDPLMHMVRNAVDHGIEEPKQRELAGKNPIGKIHIMAKKRGNIFIIEIQDDGKGINKEIILNKAISKGLIKENHQLSDAEICNLIFHNGLSTKDAATDISGRGVGMDVVQEMIKSLHGNCQITSEENKGSKFIIELPMSLSMFNGTVISIEDKRFILPNSEFIETFPLNDENIDQIDSGKYIIERREEILEVVFLNNDFAKNFLVEGLGLKRIAAVVPYAGKKYAVIFDKILSQERIMSRKIPIDVESISGISGGTILGDGNVALILGLSQLIEKRVG